MQLERRRYRDRATGEVRQAKKWTARFYDHRGVRQRMTLFSGKAPSAYFTGRLERLVSARCGGEPLGPDLMRWIGEIPRHQLQRLIELGLVDPRRISSTVPIKDHIRAWRRSIENKARTKGHIKTTLRNVEAVLGGCFIRTWGEMDVLKIGDWLADRTGPSGWSPATHNAHVQSLKQFTRWMVKHQFAVVDPLTLLETRSMGSAEREHDRRALSIEEQRALVYSAATSAVRVGGVAPQTRDLMYRVALQTGLRWGELRALEVGRIIWAKGKTPAMIVPPASGTKAGKKTGRVDRIVLRRDLADLLHRACASRTPRAKVFPGMWEKGGSLCMKHDLAHAINPETQRPGIPYVDGSGLFADFHSLRHTYMTELAAKGIAMGQMLSLARHSDPKVTERYNHASTAKLVDSVESLDSLDGAPRIDQARQAVGAESVDPATGPLHAEKGQIGDDVTPTVDPQLTSNCAPTSDFQSSALPTELSRRVPLLGPHRGAEDDREHAPSRQREDGSFPSVVRR